MRPKGRCSVSVAPVEDLQGTRAGTQLAFCSCDPAEISGFPESSPWGDEEEGGGTGS